MLPALLAAALVWVPPENFTQWSKIDGLLRANSELKLTIALTPQMTTALAKAALGPWTANGRVEIAGRVHGDPVLPLVAAHPAAPRPDDALERAAEARQAVERRMGVAAAGFVPGAGALDPSLVGPLGAAGSPWVLTGPYAAAGPWAAEGPTVFVPARAAPAGALPAPEDLTAPGVLVVDESASAETRLFGALEALRGASPKQGWATVSELVKAAGDAHPPAANIGSWPGWNGAAALAPSDPSARAAWVAYGEAAKALERYQNSGAADMKILDGAIKLLRKAQEARFFRAPEPGAAAGLPAELRADLLAAYKRIKTTAPDSLYETGTSTSPAAATDTPTGVHAASDAAAAWVGFDNPIGSIARAPAGAPNSDPWRLRGLRIEWNDERVLFRIFPSRADSAPAAPRPVYDVYVDLNHLVGAGAIRLLDGRGAFAQARDAWEFAVSVCGADARLWRAGAADEPDEIAKLSIESDPAKAEIRVSVPRELLRGNPARWGYILLALAEDPARPGRTPAAALVGPDGAQTLGLLAPLEVQKTVLEHPGTPQRVAAARLETAPPP
jgi:hypothetical protein